MRDTRSPGCVESIFHFWSRLCSYVCSGVSDLHTLTSPQVTAACQVVGFQTVALLADCSRSENLLILRAVPELKGPRVLKAVPWTQTAAFLRTHLRSLSSLSLTPGLFPSSCALYVSEWPWTCISHAYCSFPEPEASRNQSCVFLSLVRLSHDSQLQEVGKAMCCLLCLQHLATTEPGMVSCEYCCLNGWTNTWFYSRKGREQHPLDCIQSKNTSNLLIDHGSQGVFSPFFSWKQRILLSKNQFHMPAMFPENTHALRACCLFLCLECWHWSSYIGSLLFSHWSEHFYSVAVLDFSNNLSNYRV